MKPQLNTNTRRLHDLGQRIWLDNITREMQNSGTLARCIVELSVTGLTSNPTIFEHAIGSGDPDDEAIQKLAAKGSSSEDIFFELALQDLTQAADLFRPSYDASGGSDGWVSLEVSPPLVVLKEDVQPQLHNRLGVAIAMRTYKAHCDLLASERWQRLAAAGAQPQRLLWASTGTKGPAAPDRLYVEALAARLQREGVQGFARSWSGLMARIQEKCSQPAAAAERAGMA